MKLTNRLLSGTFDWKAQPTWTDYTASFNQSFDLMKDGNKETIKRIIKQVYPSHSVDLDALTNMVEELKSKIDEIKKD